MQTDEDNQYLSIQNDLPNYCYTVFVSIKCCLCKKRFYCTVPYNHLFKLKSVILSLDLEEAHCTSGSFLISVDYLRHD